MVRNKSGCKWHEILLFSQWKPQGPRKQSHSELFFAFSYQHLNIFGSSPDKFRILHLVVKSFTHQLFDFMELTLWNMVWKKIINGYYSNTFYFAMTNKNQAVVSCLRTSIHKATTVFGCEDADLQVLMSVCLSVRFQFQVEILHSK